MSLKYLNLTGLSNLVTNIKNWVTARIPTKTSEITNDSGFITSSSLPTVNNATLTIQKNGTNVQTFTANASSNKTANITVPTAVSELTNDSGFITNTSDCVHTTGNEIIAGNKYFSDSTFHTGNINLKFKRGGTVGTNPSSTMYYAPIYGTDSNDSPFFLQRGYVVASGTNAYTWYIYNWSDTSKNAWARLEINVANTSTYTFSTNYVLPSATDTTYLGSSSKVWKSVYANSYYLGTTAFGDIVTHNASEFLTSHQSLSNYSTKANTVKSLSISGKTITVTPGSGSTYTLTTQDTVYTHPTSAGNKHIPSGGSSGQFLGWDSDGTAKWVNNPNTNTDTLMTQNVSTTNATYPVLLVATADATANQGAKTGIFAKSVKVNPSTNVISASGFSGPLTGNVTGNCSGSSGSCTGNAATATLATKATGNANGKELTNTIIKGLSVSGTTITYTKIDGNTGTITTQDTVYTHPTTAGNKHIPSGGSSGQYLKYSSSGTAVWADLPTIPTKTSELTNDSGFLTSHQSLSGYLPLTGGTLTGNIIYKRSDATRGTAPSSNVTIQHCDVRDSANNRFTLLETTYYTDMSSKIALFAYKTTAATGGNIGSIGIGCTTSGTVYTFAPTPVANDNTTKIATTAWVQTFCDTTKGYLTSHQSLSNYLTKTTNISEMGRYIDMHYDNATAAYDYDVRLYVDSQGTAKGGGSFKIAAASAYAPAPASDANDTRIATTKWVNDKGYLTSHQSLSNYSTKANTVKSLSISGTTITVTPGSGSAYTLTTQDTVYTHPTSAGNKHIPSGGSSGQYLKYSASGTAVWADLPTIPTKTSQLTNDSGFLTAHQSLSDYVTLNTQQNISANKFFYGGAWRVGSNYPSFICKNNTHTVGEAAPSSMWGYGEFLIQDKNAYSVGLLSCRYDQNATQYFRIESRNKFTNGAPAVNGTAKSSVLDVGTISDGTPYVYWNSYISNGLIPRLAFAWDIGDASHPWNIAYVANYKIKSANTVLGVTGNNSTVDFIDLLDANNTQTGYIGRWQHTNGYSCITLTCYDKYDGAGNRSTSGTVANATLELGTTNTGVPYLNYNTYFMQNITPLTNDNNDLGDASHHWKNLFTGEVHCYHQNALMSKAGNYTFLLRNDGSSIWFLISEANGNEGTWSGLRPLYINCSTGACTSTSKWTFDKSFGDGDPSVLIQSGTAYANGTWNYPLAALAPNMQAGANLFMPIGRNFAAGNCAGWHFYYAGNNSNDNFLSVEFYAAGSPFAVYRDGRVMLSATPATSDNSNRVATTAFVKANAYTHPTSAGNKHIPSEGSTGQILRYSAAGTAVWANRGSFVSIATRSIPSLTSTGSDSWTITTVKDCIYLLKGSFKLSSSGASITIHSKGRITGGYGTFNSTPGTSSNTTIYNYNGESTNTTYYFVALIWATDTSLVILSSGNLSTVSMDFKA